eukprot:TRINITY_DN12819_c0_g1_i1.p1 TRINITY_DN12819_c0_g1~~TRINITY_DN12819_c0_g1_i1.p1  ORF type:complete len:126 (+),score=32.48 TRINITY_DN12819_c0_g1_i1:40-417(+)
MDSCSDTSSSSDWDPPPRADGGGMDMSQFEGKDRFEDLEQNEKVLAGDSISVKFILPNGETAVSAFPHGQTVQFLKVWLDDNHGIAYAEHNLYLNGTLLIDPLSLNDIKAFKTGVENTVEVKEKK